MTEPVPAPDTVAADAGADENTTVVPNDIATGQAELLAWSDDTVPATRVEDRRPLPRALKLLLCIVGVGAVGVGAFLVGGQQRQPSAPVPGPILSPSTITVTALAPTSAVTAPPGPSDDQRFLAMLSRDGVRRPVSVPDAIAMAADVCRMVQHGDDLGYIESWMEPPHGVYTQNESEAFVADALTAYCPHAGMSR